MVVAVPLASPVERHDEAVRALERLERTADRVVSSTASQRPPHILSSTDVCVRNRASASGSRDRSSRRKYSDTNRSSPANAIGARRVRRPGLHRERGEIEAGRPALGPLGQVGDAGRVELHTRAAEQRGRLLLVEPEIGHADLVQPPLRPPAGEGQAGSSLLAMAICEPAGTCSHSAASTSRQAGFATACRSSSTSTNGRSRDASALPRRGTRVDQIGAARAGQRVEHLGRERLDAVERGRDVPQEQDGVVVPAVEGDPREGTRILLGPPRQQRRLAVPGGRDDAREGQRRLAQRRDHVGLDDDAGSSGGGASFASMRSKGGWSATATAGKATSRPRAWATSRECWRPGAGSVVHDFRPPA